MSLSFGAPIRSYDVHVYFEDSDVDQARELQQEIKATFPQLKVYKFWKDPIGPHPIGNFEVNLRDPHEFLLLVPWIQLNHRHFSVLVHPNTGHPIRDHTYNAMWIGDKVALNTACLQEDDDSYGYF